MKLFKLIFPGKNLHLLNEVMPRRLFLFDIGARGGMQDPWDLLTKKQISLTLAEPDPDEARKLTQQYGADFVSVLPTAFWKQESQIILNINRSPGTSSVFPINKSFLEQFPDSERYNVVRRHELPALTIDRLASLGKIEHMDFLKIDVQGAELAVLQGGRDTLLSNLVGLEVEVEFAELYEGQPLFGDVESFIRTNLGLELWDIRKTYWKYRGSNRQRGPVKGRLIFGDALFFRPVQEIEKWLSGRSAAETEEKLIMLFVTAITYGYPDYASTIVSLPISVKCIAQEKMKTLKTIIRLSTRDFRLFPFGNRRLYMIFDALAKTFQPTHEGWASIERSLGSRRWKGFWL